MAPLMEERNRANAGVPLGGQVMSVVISLAATTVLTLFLTQRFLVIKNWGRLPFVVWLVFAIYIDSYVFVFATAILQHSFGVNSSLQKCQGAILLCLACYVTTKIFIYLFLVEKAYIIRETTRRRMQSRLYLFNTFGMLSVYIVVVILNFVYRITRMEKGQCIIGMQSVAMIPLISFDTVVNVYLTIIFLIPLKNLYTFKNMARTLANMRLRTIAFRTFFGAVCTLLSSIVNLSVLMALNGEPGWVCLMCCNCDSKSPSPTSPIPNYISSSSVLFSAVVIQWVTSKDNAGTNSLTSSNARDQPANTVPPSGGGPTLSSTHRQPFTPEAFSSTSSPAEIALVTRPSSSGGATSTLDGHPHKPPGAVVITTTIKRESQPSDHVCDGPSTDDDEAVSNPYDDEGDHLPGYRGSRRMSCGPLGTDGFVTSRTCITGGSRHHPHHHY